MGYPASATAYSILNTKVLILNRSYLPIHVTSVRRAFVLLYQGIAKAVNDQYQTFDFESWSDLSISARDETVGLVNRVIRVPGSFYSSPMIVCQNAKCVSVDTNLRSR